MIILVDYRAVGVSFGWVPINWSIANETIFQQKEGKSS